MDSPATTMVERLDKQILRTPFYAVSGSRDFGLANTVSSPYVRDSCNLGIGH